MNPTLTYQNLLVWQGASSNLQKSILSGSWVVVSDIISLLVRVITIAILLITRLVTTRETTKE